MGAYMAKWLNKHKIRLALCDCAKEALSNVQNHIKQNGGTCLASVINVANIKQCQKFINNTLSRFGRLDGLINNAGTLKPIDSIGHADPDAWHNTIKVNLLGPFYLIQASLPALRKNRGRIVNMSSGAAINPFKAWSAYCVSKAALTHFTRVLAVEEPDITTLSMRPGIVDTEMQKLIRSDEAAAMSSENASFFKKAKSEGRLLHPMVPARAAAWLSLSAPHDWSGEFIEYNDPRIVDQAIAFFGEVPE
jgi:NAD(P)-dependent dehydrogenase (short-subunit alcohol dehydrogenase family)